MLFKRRFRYKLFPKSNTPQAKELWFERLQQCINKSKEKEGKTSTTIQISYWDQLIHEEKYTLIKVGNRDTIHQTIKLALEDLKLCDGEDQLKPCDPSDYQLWVKTSKDDTPYPLIGHEYPFSIKMNFVRDLLYRSNLDLHNFNNIAADNKCIFILRKNGKSLINSNSNNENSKAMKLPKKTKRSAINWMAIKSRMTLKSESSIDSGVNSEPTTPTKGKLFGQHLDLLCSGGSLPNPIMNMLKVLFEKGPFTVGIFRKSANARVCKEFRAKLESDPDADVTDVPVMVISSVFKEFLRSLPDCLLQSSLYPKWIEAISIENNLECRSKMSQLLSELPTSNLLLLRHFLCTLWYIAQRSPINKMCSVNLGVCVGQSMLTPHPIGSPNIQLPSTQRCEEMSKQVPKIIAYLIDHCPDLMGESTLNLFGLPPGQEDVHHHQVLRQNDSGAEESDSLNSLPDHGVGSNITTSSSGGNRRDDSSIDSLERALFDDGTNGSPSNKTSNFGTSNKMSLSNLSRDSGLTLSDTQLYSPEDEDEGSRSPCKEESPLGYPFLTKSVPHLDSAGLDSSINVTFSYGRSAGVSIDGSCHDVVRKRRHHNGLMANEIPNYFNQKHNPNQNQNHYNHNQRNRYSSPIQSHHQQQHQHYNQHNHNHHIPIHYSKSYSYGINGDDVTDSVNVNREYRYRRPPLAAVLGGAPQAQQVNYDNYLRRSNSEESLVRPFDDQVNYQLTSLPIQSNYEPATTQTTKSQTTYYQPTRINQINERVNSICSSETQSQRSSISKQSTGSLRSNPLGIHPPSYQQAMNRKEMIARSVGQITLRKTSSASSASGNSNHNHIYEESVRIYQQDIQSLTNQTHRAVPVRVKTFDSDEENEPNKINIMNMNGVNHNVNHTVNLINGHHKPQLQRVASEGTTLKPGPRVVRISSAQTMNPHQFISNSHSFVHPSHHSHQQSQNHQINVLQRSAKDFIEEEWRKDIHCSVARLRTIFNANNSNLNQQQNQVTIKQGVRQGSVLINENQNQFNNKLSSVSSANKLEPTGPCVTVVHVTSSDQTDCHCNGTKSIITVHRRDSIENSSSEEESYV